MPRRPGRRLSLSSWKPRAERRRLGLAVLPVALLASLELLERLRPIILQQPRQTAIGEQLAAGLAGRTVIGFVGRVLNALNRRAAHRTRLAVAAVRGHALSKRGHLLGKVLAGLGDQLVAPLRQDADRVRVQALDLFRCQLARQQHRRHLRGVKDLVRVGVADAAQQMRIRQRALQGVILARQRLAELLDRRRQHFEAAGIVRRQLAARRARDTARHAASSRLRSGSMTRCRSRMPRGRPCRESSRRRRASGSARRSSGE